MGMMLRLPRLALLTLKLDPSVTFSVKTEAPLLQLAVTQFHDTLGTPVGSLSCTFGSPTVAVDTS